MHNRTRQFLGPGILMAGLISAASLPAANLTFQTLPPTPGTNDIYNFVGASNDGVNVSDGGAYADGAANDAFTYIAVDRPSQGQTFTTGSNPAGYEVRAVWLRHCGYTNNVALTWYRMDAASVMTVRITDPAQAGTAGFALASESYTITGSEPNKLPAGAFFNSTNGTGTWLRFGLGTPVSLAANTTYGFDITTLSGLCFFETFGASNDVYASGSAYSGSTLATPDNTLNPRAGDRAFLVEMVGQTLPPSILSGLNNQLVIGGTPASFTVTVSGTPPFAYQWYFNQTNALADQTNGILALAAVTPSQVGGYSVVITNAGGGVTSGVARLSIILPSVSTQLNLNAPGSGIVDANGVGTPFTTRLEGTGASLPSPDTYLLLDTSAGTLVMTSTTCDYNGQLLMDMAEAPGILLSSIGFNGTQDFSVTGTFTNLPTANYVNYDQVGVFVGASSSNLVRGGLIFNSDFANLSSYGVATPGLNDVGIATAAAPPAEMVVTIARSSGNWSVLVNGLNVTPGASLAFLDSYTNLTVGVFALDTSGVNNTATLDRFEASLFAGPRLTAASGGGNLTLDWNVIGSGLQSNTNLANPSGWASVAGTAGSNRYVIPLPTAGRNFYRLVP